MILRGRVFRAVVAKVFEMFSRRNATVHGKIELMNPEEKKHSKSKGQRTKTLEIFRVFGLAMRPLTNFGLENSNIWSVGNPLVGNDE